MAEEDVKNIKQEATDTPVKSDAETSVKPAAARKRKNKRSVPVGRVSILASFNNTIITVADSKGATLVTTSAGSSGFRGSKKGTAYAAQVAAEKALSTAKQNHGLGKVSIFVKGVGLGRDAAIRTTANQNIEIESIQDVTGVPHGGVRPRKAKRN